jgi:8-oxo-dGTP diphosphatase
MAGNSARYIVAVTGLITGPEDKVLMIRSPRRGWELPGGQVDEGESLFKALQRETLEESGVVIQTGALTGIYNNLRPPPKLTFGFLGSWISGELTMTVESNGTEWVARDQVLQRITQPILYDRIKDMLEFSGRVVYRVFTTDPYVKIHRGYV